MNQQNHGTEFLFGAPFWGQAPNGPEIENWIPPTVFELGPSFFQGLLATREPTKL